MPPVNPRRAAFDLLLHLEHHEEFADRLLDRELSGGGMTGSDRGLFTELVYGVLRRQGSLDYIMGQFSSQAPEKLEPSVRILLRLGLYQLFYLHRIPVSAAVNETVKLGAAIIPRAKGFINAVLRAADRGRDHLTWPDRQRDPVRYLAARHSHPHWLVVQWRDQLGPAEAELLAEAMAEPPPLTARVNTLKITRPLLMDRLGTEGVATSPCRFSPLGVRVQLSGPIGRVDGFRDGLFTIQDESSQLAALLLDPQPGERILDLCAAPGGKATALAQLMENRGNIVAGDVSDRKLHLVDETAGRLGIGIITTRRLDAASPPPEFRGAFHRVLVDAPCSGLGVLRRNPEGKWRRTPEDVQRLAVSQQRIIAAAAGCVIPGGILVYSTCSTSREENEAVVADFLSRHPDFVLEDGRVLFPHWGELFTEHGMFRSWPHRHDGMDGFFAARMKRTHKELSA